MLFITTKIRENYLGEQEIMEQVNLATVTVVSHTTESLLVLKTADGKTHSLEGDLLEQALDTIQKYSR